MISNCLSYYIFKAPFYYAMIVSDPIQGISTNALNINQCIFRWLINSNKGSAVTVERDSVSSDIKNSYFIGCVSRYAPQTKSFSGSICIISGSSTFRAFNLIFISSYGNGGSSILYQGASTSPGNIDIQNTITTGCWGRWAVIDIFFCHNYARNYNSSFCNILTLHNFCIEYYSFEVDASFFIFYRNCGAIQFCSCCTSKDGSFTYGAFIQNKHTQDGYGLVHVNEANGILLVNNVIFMNNTEALFNSINGKFIVANVTCDYWSYNGNDNDIEKTQINSNTYTSFPSPVPAIDIMNLMTLKAKNKLIINPSIALFTIFFTHS